MSNYISAYTGPQIDSAYTSAPTLITQSAFDALDPATMPPNKLYIISDGSNINSLYRSNGVEKVRVGGSGGGGGGSDVRPVLQPGLVTENTPFYGLLFANTGQTYKVGSTYVSQDPSGTADDYILEFL